MAPARWNCNLHRLRAGGNAARFFPSRSFRLRGPPAGDSESCIVFTILGGAGGAPPSLDLRTPSGAVFFAPLRLACAAPRSCPHISANERGFSSQTGVLCVPAGCVLRRGLQKCMLCCVFFCLSSVCVSCIRLLAAPLRKISRVLIYVLLGGGSRWTGACASFWPPCGSRIV